MRLGVRLHAVPGALVEGFVLELPHVGNEAELVLTVCGYHGVLDVVGVDRFRESAHSAQQESHRQQHSQKLLHEKTSIFILAIT